MSSIEPVSPETTPRSGMSWGLAGGIILGAAVFGALGYVVFKVLPIGHPLSSFLSWLFATNTTRTTWYMTRAAGWIAYFLLWFSMVWGLAIPSKLFEKFLSPTFAVDFHEYLSLLATGFVVLHVTVLMFDQYLPFTLAQILVPFKSTYRPFWVGLGIIGAYLSGLVTVTFYMRKKIGQKRFKSIHTLSVFGYLGVILHAFLSGSDSSLPIVQLIYISSFLVVVFMTAYWLLVRGKEIGQEKGDRPALHKARHAVRH